MPLHLAEIALAAAPGAHAGLLTDRVGRHMTASARPPANTSIIARCRRMARAEPAESIRQLMRDNRPYITSSRLATPSSTTAAKPGTAADQPWRTAARTSAVEF